MAHAFRRSSWIVQKDVISALIVRDMHTRFGRTIYGFCMMIFQPLFQLSFMMTVFMTLRGRVPLVGSDPYVFWGVTLLPYILFVFPVATMMGSLTQNMPLMGFPIVKSFDVILSRAILAILTAFWVIFLFALGLSLLTVDVLPRHPADCAAAILATIYLALSFGWLGAVMVRLTRFWAPFKAILMMLMYFTSGVFFLPEGLPKIYQDIFWYNPLLHCVEWFRSSYYEGFGYGLLNRTYLFSFATVLLFLGLLLEKVMRGYILQK
jgi:capsular polysaccharide transport system permease protein